MERDEKTRKRQGLVRAMEALGFPAKFGEAVADGLGGPWSMARMTGDLAARARYVLSVCNGAYLYAKAGALDGRLTTTYKGHGLLDRACELFPQVKWQRCARWTVDGKFYVSSGISAGTDMSLGFIANVFGREKAEAAARYAEYTWNDDPANDPFAV